MHSLGEAMLEGVPFRFICVAHKKIRLCARAPAPSGAAAAEAGGHVLADAPEPARAKSCRSITRVRVPFPACKLQDCVIYSEQTRG